MTDFTVRPHTCGNCGYWQRDSANINEGECRVHAPTMVVLPMVTLQGNTIQAVPVIPRVPEAFWCGDHTALQSGPSPALVYE